MTHHGMIRIKTCKYCIVGHCMAITFVVDWALDAIATLQEGNI